MGMAGRLCGIVALALGLSCGGTGVRAAQLHSRTPVPSLRMEERRARTEDRPMRGPSRRTEELQVRTQDSPMQAATEALLRMPAEP